MSPVEIDSVPPQIERDHWGRPLVIPPGGGRPVPYTRCTTYVGCVEDMFKIGQWQQRHVARGVALHDDLIAAIRDTDPENKDGLDALVDEAKTRSGAGDAARLGSYMHSVTEAADRGQDPGAVELPWLSTGPADPSAYIADLAAYLEATEPFKALAIEQFTVQDPLKVGGTPDRVVRYNGKRYIADLKTGSIEWGTLKIAAQLAMYARSRPYDVATGNRLDPHGAELDQGIIIHLPVGSATCRLYWVDLLAGWQAVLTARDVRACRQNRWAQLARELRHVPGPPRTLVDQIALTTSAEETRALWVAHMREWTPELTEVARLHIETLTAAATITATEETTP